MTEIEAHRAKARKIAQDARERAVATLGPLIGQFQLTDWSEGALASLWKPHQFPWPAMSNLYPDPDRLELAIWVAGRLVGLGLCRTSDGAVIVQAIEGDPEKTCPLKGKRALIAFEAAALYAQARGKKELWVQPKNEELVNLYRSDYGFRPFPPETGSPYLWKKV